MSAAREQTARRIGGQVAWLPLLGLAIWDINDATGPQAVPNATIFLGILSAIFMVAVLHRQSALVYLPRAPVALIFLCVTLGIAMVPLRADFYAQNILSDIGTLLFFLLCMVLAHQYMRELTSTRTVLWFVILYAVIAVVAYYAGIMNLRPAFYYAGRFDPPYFMLLGGLALLIRYSTRGAMRLVATAPLLALFWLALESGNRTQFLLGLLCVFLAWASNRPALFAMVTTAIGYAFLNQIGVFEYNPLAGVLTESRFGLLTGGTDESLTGRFEEVTDIWYHLTTLNSPAQTVFGRGAGAMWEPVRRLRVPVDANGYIYYLHIGFAHMTYRFGIAGLALFCYWMWAAAKNSGIIFDRESTVGERFWSLGAIGFSLNFFLQNSLYDPPAALAMAILLVMAYQRSNGSGSDSSSEPVVSSRRTPLTSPSEM